MEEAAGRTLVDTVLDLADKDNGLDDESKIVILAALDSDEALQGHVDGTWEARDSEVSGHVGESDPVGAFVSSISVAGFRGIGSEAKLALQPKPGITIVSGRNGSGKSSFAEALEYAVTGNSYRFRNKAKFWADSWRNIHASSPCSVRVRLAVEGLGETTVGVDWSDDSPLDGHSVWTQVAKAKRQDGNAQLGWSNAVELYRPILSYDELGRLFDGGPSGLYDALAKLLGLDEIADAEKRLTVQLKSSKASRVQANDALKKLKLALDGASDDRATEVLALLKKKAVDLDAVERLATGAGSEQDGTIASLRRAVTAQAPDLNVVRAAAQELRDAIAKVSATTDGTLEVAERQNALLRQALEFHSAAGDSACPVCGQGNLDSAWRSRVQSAADADDVTLAEFRAARMRVNDARRDVRGQVAKLGSNVFPAGLDMPSISAYRAAIDETSTVPSDDIDLADFAEHHAEAVSDAINLVIAEVSEALKTTEATWSPLASEAIAWIALERSARAMDPKIQQLSSAKNWVSRHAADLRNRRLEPIAEKAREIWSELRQESNVDLGAITLEGRATQRHVSLQGMIDGAPAGALSVMSQGELHALALALFIPRATAERSPFRFLVLDDPIQAMDPAKVDGFVKVLARLAKSRQVIVFSHDDRLAATIRQLSVDARLVEVSRGPESRVSVVDATTPAERFVEDAYAMIADENVSDEIKLRAAPGIFRLAVESAARDMYATRRYAAGATAAEVESEWLPAKSTAQKLSLALHSDMRAKIGSWQHHRAHRQPTLAICTAGTHRGASLTLDDVRDLRKTVSDLVSGS